MLQFKVIEEFFLFIENTISTLEKSGHKETAELLKAGYKSVDGSTEGYAKLLKVVENIILSKKLSGHEAELIQDIHSVVSKAIPRS